MKDTDHGWLGLFLLSCAYWLIASGALKFDPAAITTASAAPTQEQSKLESLLSEK